MTERGEFAMFQESVNTQMGIIWKVFGGLASAALMVTLWATSGFNERLDDVASASAANAASMERIAIELSRIADQNQSIGFGIEELKEIASASSPVAEAFEGWAGVSPEGLSTVDQYSASSSQRLLIETMTGAIGQSEAGDALRALQSAGVWVFVPESTMVVDDREEPR